MYINWSANSNRYIRTELWLHFVISNFVNSNFAIFSDTQNTNSNFPNFFRYTKMLALTFLTFYSSTLANSNFVSFFQMLQMPTLTLKLNFSYLCGPLTVTNCDCRRLCCFPPLIWFSHHINSYYCISRQLCFPPVTECGHCSPKTNHHLSGTLEIKSLVLFCGVLKYIEVHILCRLQEALIFDISMI